MSCACDKRKDVLRAEAKRARAAMPSAKRAQVDARIAERICSLACFSRAETVFAYLAFGAEVETRGVIHRAWALGKHVALPRCVPGARRMEWFAVDSLDGLEKSPFGPLEPRRDVRALVDPSAEGGSSVALVPGLAFDEHGFRLGYGGGFYDAFLASFPGASAGLCREVQLVPSLAEVGAVGGHDVPVGAVVTEERVLQAACYHRERCGARGGAAAASPEHIAT